MSKKLYPAPQAFVINKSLLLATLMLVLGVYNQAFGQCNVGSETDPLPVNPVACNNGSLHLGSGAYYIITISANTYYNWTFANGSGCVNGFCAQPQNGNAVGFTVNTNNWFSGTTTSLLISANRNGCFNGTSAVMTYRFSQPTVTAAAAAPNPICQGSTLNLTSTTADAATITWSGPAYSGVGNNPSETNIQPANAGVYTVTADNGGCTATRNTASVTVNGTPTANAGGNQTMCSSAGSVSITGASATNDGSVSWGTSGSGTFAGGATLTPTYTPSGADITAGTVTLTLTSHGVAPCGNVTSTKTLTIVGAPTANAGGNQTACSNAGVVSITGASATNTGNGLTWTTSGSGVFTNGNTLTPSYTPSAADLTAGSVTLTLTVNATAPCIAVTSTKTLTFIAAPTATAGANQTTCSNAGAVSITGASDTHVVSVNWTSTGSGTFTGGATLTPTYTPSGADITAGSVTLTLTVTGNAPCATATSTKTLTITAAPVVNAGANQTTCSSIGAVSITGATSSNTTGVAWTTSGTGTFANGGTLTPSYTPSAGDITAGSVTLTLTGSGNAPCASATSTKTLTIVPAAAPNAGGNQSTCSTAGAVSITGASSPNSASVNWTTSGTGTFTGATTLTPTYTPSGADITAGTVTLTLTATGNAPCGTATATKTLTITTAPTVSAGANQTTCSSAGAVSITGATDSHVASINWTTSGSGTFANGTTLTPSYTPSPGDITAGTVTLTLTGTGNAPCGTVTSTKTLTIVAAPVPNAGGNQSTCSTSGAVSITGASAPNSTSVAWTSSGSGTFTGATTLTPTYTPSGADITAGSVTLTLTAGANTPCTSVTATKTLTITAAPTVSAGSNQTTCSSVGAVSITGAAGTNVASVAWTTSGTGAFSNGATLTPSYTPSAGDITAGSVTLTLTGTGNSPCGTVTSTKTLTIVAAPAPNAGGNQSICSTAGSVAITGASSPNSASINWTTSGTGTFTGGATLTPTYTPSGADITAGNVTLTLTATGNAPCSFVTSSKTLTITGAPTAVAGANQTICSSTATVGITGASATNDASVSWTTSGTGTFTNEFTLTPTYIPSASDITAGTVTLTLTAVGNSPCAPVTSSKTLTIVAAPAPNAGPNQSTCSNAGAVSITGASSPHSISVNWTSSGTGTFTGATTLTPTYTPSGADITAGSVTLTLTATGTAPCTTVTATKTLTIVPPPTANAGPALSTCANSGTVDISGASATNYSSLLWTTSGTGTFTNSTTLVTGYTPSGADTVAGSVTLTLTANGNGTCTAVTSTVVLTIHPLPTGSISGTTTICSGSSATLTFNLFTASPFNVVYNAGVNVITVNGITNGHTISVSPPVGSTSYQLVSITDNNSCTRSGSFQGGATVTVTPTPVVSYTSTPASCNGTNTGSITINAASGTPGYTYSIDSGLIYQASNLFSNLPQGNDYVLEVKDSRGCTAFYASNPVSITQPPTLTQTDSVTNASCAGVSNGSIIVTASGGVTPYSYSLNAGPLQSGNTFSALSAGNYVVGIEDVNGCTDTTHVTISNTSVITDTLLNQTNVSCFGGSNGALTVQLNGGVGPNTYSDNGNIFQNSPTFTGLNAGTYVITLRDSRGCTDFISATIIQPAMLNAVVDSIHNISCNGSSQGAIYISVSGGTTPYTYSWSNSSTAQNLTNAAAGTYFVTITDAKGCNTTVEGTITEPVSLFANVATAHNLNCYNDSSGYIYVTANGGVPPYQYSWSNGATTQDISGLHAGTYGVTIQDANGCQVNLSQLITQPTQLTSTIAATPVSCNGASNGSVTFSAGGGTSPYTYLWNNGATTQSLNNISGGEYTVIVHDANGCSLSNSVNVAEPAAIVLGISSTNVSCHGGTNGTVTTTVTGGTGTIIYDWSNSATTASLTNVGAGNYSVIITDANSCTASASVTVTQPAALVINGTVANVSCAGGANGSIDVTVNGGVFPYSYLWSNGATTQNINGVIAATYNVTVTDVNLCTIADTFTVTAPSPIVSSVVGTNVTCHGEANGTATLTVSGGTSPYSFTWSNFHATQNLSGLSGGTYYVIITDANGCTKRDSVIITEPAAIVLTLTSTNVNCNGDSTASITTTVSGGTGTITYAWSNTATTANLTNIPAGTYSVVITDANSCTASASVTITQPTAMVINGTVANVLCAGGSNGSVDITVNGGVFPYTYSWSNNATTQNINGLSGGTYRITVTDANLCTIVDSFSVSEPVAITSSIVGTNVTCHGEANGTATLTVSGGTTPYSFFWSNFQASQNLSGLSGGTYYVIITDANGCTHRDSVVIAEPTAIIINLAVTNVTCNGAASGSISATGSGGTGVIGYSWSNGATTSTISNLVAGTYTYTGTDGNGCSVIDSTTITQPTALALNGTVTNVSCFGGNNGAVQISIGGGVPPYTFSWSNAATSQNINGLTGGVTYTVTATDVNLCTVTASFNITSPTALVATITGTDVTCHGANDGSATMSVTGGTGPYTYLWSNFQGGATINNLSGGLYYAIVTDANGCTIKDSILINEPTQLVITTSVTQITCFNADNGVIDVTVSGGNPTYNYLWSPTLPNSPNQSNLAGGSYSVTVSDAHSCTISTEVNLINPPSLAINFVVTNPKCYGDSNGSINMIISGGQPGYTFVWNIPADTLQQITNAFVGTYYVTVTDANHCVKDDSVIVATPGQLYTSGVIKNVSCSGKSDGQINITVYGGTLPYGFSWSYNNVSTQNLYQIPGGSYYVTVTDANGCQVASLYVVREPTALTTGLSATNVSCFGGHDGTVTSLPSGGTTPYRYTWEGAVSSDSIITSLSAGLYGLQLTDSNSCFVFDSILVTQPTQITVTGFSNNALCFNTATGSVLTTPSGGTPGYTFAWSNGGVDSAINTISAGVYTETVTDANHCSVTASFTVTQGAKLTVQLATYDPICHDGTTGAITSLTQGGAPPYTYAWSSGANDTAVSVNHLLAGSYSVTVTDHVGCTVTGDANLNQPAAIAVAPAISGVKCYNLASGLIVVNTSGGTPPFNYSLNGFGQPSDTFTNVLPGRYELTATDVNGCQGTDTFSISTVNNVSVTLSVNDQVIVTGMETQLVATATSNTPIIHYIWTPIAVDSADVFDYTSCPDSSNCSTPYVKPPYTTIFTVTAMNADSCTASDTVTVYVKNDNGLAFIPTAFTPNGDGLNDRFTFAILGANTIAVTIFDRWGEKVYYDPAQPNGVSNSYGWDGTKNGKNAPEDTYVYQLSITYFDNTVRTKAGTITIVR